MFIDVVYIAVASSKQASEVLIVISASAENFVVCFFFSNFCVCCFCHFVSLHLNSSISVHCGVLLFIFFSLQSLQILVSVWFCPQGTLCLPFPLTISVSKPQEEQVNLNSWYFSFSATACRLCDASLNLSPA